MGLFNYLRTAVLGVDIDEEQRRSDAATAHLAALNEARGWAPPVDLIAEGGVTRAAGSFESQVDEAFTDELNARAKGFKNAADALISGSIGTALRLVPNWAWVAAAGFAAFYFWPIIGPRVRSLFARK